MGGKRGLEVNEDRDYQRREWRIEHIGYAIWAVILAAALAGAFGSGPLSDRERKSADGSLYARYEGIDRLHSEFEILLRFARPPVRDGAVRLAVGAGILQDVVIERVQPASARVTNATGRLIYEFPAADPVEMTVRLVFRASRFGRHEFVFSLENGAEVRCPIVVLP
jgi:hypothetical protein